jgi:hypothetical protein
MAILTPGAMLRHGNIVVQPAHPGELDRSGGHFARVSRQALR